MDFNQRAQALDTPMRAITLDLGLNSVLNSVLKSVLNSALDSALDSALPNCPPPSWCYIHAISHPLFS